MIGDSIHVKWNENGENHDSEYSSDIFKKQLHMGPKPVYWDSQSVRMLPTKISYHELQGTVGMKKMMDMLDSYGFVLVNNVDKSLKGTEELATKISYVRSTIYGTMWTLIPNMEMEDTAYTRMELKPHTDGCYLQDPPGIQIFHILEHDGTGGETTLVDGFKVVKELQEKDPAAFEFFAKTPIDFQYLDPNNHLYQKRTVFDLDENGDPIRFHYNNDDRAPVVLPSDQLKIFYTSLRKMLTLIRSPKFIFKFRLIPGECLITDNWRVLHGRTSFTGHRKLVGCYLNHEDHVSRGLVLRKNFL
jgi:trimethyllysine dioxygenase